MGCVVLCCVVLCCVVVWCGALSCLNIVIIIIIDITTNTTIIYLTLFHPCHSCRRHAGSQVYNTYSNSYRIYAAKGGGRDPCGFDYLVEERREEKRREREDRMRRDETRCLRKVERDGRWPRSETSV